MNNKIEVLANGKTRVALDKAPEGLETAVIFIPGVNGKAFTDKYKTLMERCLNEKLDFLRVQSWENVEEIEQKTIHDIQEDVSLAIEFLKTNGYKKIFAIGKSLGGGILLTHYYPEITKMVLWAPAIGLSEEKGNLDNKIDLPFFNINSMLEVTVDKNLLSTIKIPVKIIHGDKDETVPIDNSLKLASLLLYSDVTKIKDLGHSAETPEQEKELVDKTVGFLSPN